MYSAAAVRKPPKRNLASDGSADDKGDLVDAGEPLASRSLGGVGVLTGIALASSRQSPLQRARDAMSCFSKPTVCLPIE
jgi:hypothetical protein